MYEFDDSIPLAELAGLQIIQVCFGVHDIIIRLENQRSISVFVKSRFYEDNGWDHSSGNSIMLGLVGKTIRQCVVLGASKAQLVTDDGAFVDFIDSPQNFESFAFALSTGEYVV